jgi:type I protein arginine methyltransferase
MSTESNLSEANLSEENELGQYIPLHYHFHMLKDAPRMEPFREAVTKATPEGGTILELGGGTGVLSWFAAQKAKKIYCVERNPEMAEIAKKFLKMNTNGHRVEVIQGDASTYVPPEPVDLVICEMIHTAMIREKQMDVIQAFKNNYRKAFPTSKMPKLLPEAIIQAVQPIQENYSFYGYNAPVPLFEEAFSLNPDSIELGDPVVYQILDFQTDYSLKIQWKGEIEIKKAGVFNSLRFVLKNLLTIIPEENRSIDWHCRYIIIPLPEPRSVKVGAKFQVELDYVSGCSMKTFMDSVKVRTE